MHRFIEFFIALIALVVLLPFFILISFFILFDSKGGVFFRQVRVGRDNRDFILFKFRTMVPGASQKGLLTTGNTDKRVTRTGAFLRTYKLDELPQFYNILKGDMSLVGPRPEVRKYVNLYTAEQKKVLTVRPGLTDYASLEYLNEGDLLAGSKNPEETYIRTILPAKLALNLKYLEDKSFTTDLKIILKTVSRILAAN